MESIHPTIFDIALDFLPIQASAVPSERVFSSSAETNTNKHNHIHPVLMEVLQMMKYALKKRCLDFMAGWITDENLMQDPAEPESDLLGNMFKDDFDTALDNILVAIAEYH